MLKIISSQEQKLRLSDGRILIIRPLKQSQSEFAAPTEIATENSATGHTHLTGDFKQTHCETHRLSKIGFFRQTAPVTLQSQQQQFENKSKLHLPDGRTVHFRLAQPQE